MARLLVLKEEEQQPRATQPPRKRLPLQVKACDRALRLLLPEKPPTLLLRRRRHEVPVRSFAC